MKKFLPVETTQIKEAKYAVVDFFADWCGPCKMMAPEFEKAEIEIEKKGVLCGKVNVDECEDFAMQNKIEFVPTVIFFKNGVETNRFVGPKTKDGIVNFVESCLN